MEFRESDDTWEFMRKKAKDIDGMKRRVTQCPKVATRKVRHGWAKAEYCVTGTFGVENFIELGFSVRAS